MANDELIRKKDALDALMAERKDLLAKGQKGAEHILTHHGYNVIDELPPVQSDVPEMNVGDMISRRAATTIPVMPKEHRHYQTSNLDDAYEQGWNDLQECVENLPPVQPKRGKWIYGERRKFIDLANADEQYKILGYPHRPYVNMTCSCCRMITIVDETILYNYCPHCGADMRGEVDG